MFEAEDFLRLRETSSFCNMRQEKSSASPLPINQQRTHFAGERQGRPAAGVTLASLGMALAIIHILPSSKPSPPMSIPHHQVASTVKIDPL